MGKYKFFSLFVLIIIISPFIVLPRLQEKKQTGYNDKTRILLIKEFGGFLEIIGKNIVDPVLMVKDDPTLKPILNKLVTELQKIDGIEEVVICNLDGEILASSDLKKEGKKLKEVYKIDINQGKFSQLNLIQNNYYLRVPIKMEVGIEEKNIGNIVVRISKRFAEELTGILIKEGSKFKNMDIYIGLGALVIGFLILQLFVFSPISKRINLLEKRAKEVKKIEDLKKLEEKSRETLKELEEKKEELEKEIDELKKKVEEKRKEVEESEVGKIIKELEEKREILEREVEKLKREEEEVRKRLSAQKMEQEELKKRLDLIRQKMKKLMET